VGNGFRHRPDSDVTVGEEGGGVAGEEEGGGQRGRIQLQLPAGLLQPSALLLPFARPGVCLKNKSQNSKLFLSVAEPEEP
jgi:hypothetical protein